MRPRQRPYTPSRLPDEPVIVDVEHRPVPPAAGFSDTWADYAVARPTLEEFWPVTVPVERIRPGGQVWQITSLSE